MNIYQIKGDLKPLYSNCYYDKHHNEGKHNVYQRNARAKYLRSHNNATTKKEDYL